MNATYSTPAPTESDLISADIQNTRECMNDTLDKIGARMKPRHLLDELLGLLNLTELEGDRLKRLAGAAADSASEGAERVAHAVGSVIRHHPIPTLLVGAGVAYAIYESRRGPQERSGRYPSDESGDGSRDSRGHGLKELAAEGVESAREGIQSVKEKVKTTVASAGQCIEETSHSLRKHAVASMHAIGEKASQLTDQVADSAQRGYEISCAKFSQTSQEHPLSVGLGFLAAGLLVGVAIPHTHQEDEWMGEASDRIKDRAKTEGEELYERGKHIATAAAETVKKSAEQEGLTPQALLERAERVVSTKGPATGRSSPQDAVRPASPSPLAQPPGPPATSEPQRRPEANANPPQADF